MVQGFRRLDRKHVEFQRVGECNARDILGRARSHQSRHIHDGSELVLVRSPQFCRQQNETTLRNGPFFYTTTNHTQRRTSLSLNIRFQCIRVAQMQIHRFFTHLLELCRGHVGSCALDHDLVALR